MPVDSVSKKLFDTLAGYQESSEDEKLAPVGVHRYGRARVPKQVKTMNIILVFNLINLNFSIK